MKQLFASQSRRVTLAAVVASIVLLVPILVAQSGPAGPPPPPGRLVDIGGWRMHINCTGQRQPGEPTVVLESGASGFSVDWSLVQPKVATVARVCSYDRSGYGWSELGPYPHTMRQTVYELHTLLERAGVPGPYALVGQSFGGRLVRLFAATYPTETAGMVLVDAGHDDDLLFINGKWQREWETATGQPVPPVKTSMPLHVEDLPPEVQRQLAAAAQQTAPSANDPPYNKLPAAAQQARAWALSQLKHYAANNSSFTGDETAAMRADRQRTDHPLGDMPVIVLSRGEPITTGPRPEEREQERKQQQADLVALSRNGKQVIATRSGHHIHIDEPDLVVGAIREVLVSARKSQ